MRMYLRTESTEGLEVILEHGVKKLFFNVSVFGREAFTKNPEVFDFINLYWERESPLKQGQIFTIYEEIARMFEECLSNEELTLFLQKSVVSLIEHHPLAQLESWISAYPGKMIPPTVRESYKDSIEDNNTRDKTYTLKDYMELISLSLFFRTMIPIWGEYIASVRGVTGGDRKEFAAVKLLTHTSIMDAPAMMKLSSYIQAFTADRAHSMDKTLRGISSQDAKFYLLSLLCVKKIPLADLSGYDPRRQIVSVVYHFICQSVFNPDNRTSLIQEKKIDDEDSRDQNKHSVLESFRNREEISIGDIAIINHVTYDVETIVRRLAPDLKKDALYASLDSAQALLNERIGDPQLAILSWIFKDSVPPKGILYVDKEVVVRALGGLEAILWHWGHHYLATVATSHLVIGIEEMAISQIDSRKQIPEELASELKRYYPYVWSTARKRADIMKTGLLTQEEPHPVLNDIDLVMDDLVQNAWRKTASEEKVLHTFGSPEKKLRIRPDTKSDLARLIIDSERRRSLSH